jgi:O-antigen/teichoic acid export membrane protein
MKKKSIFQQESSDIKDIFKRFRKRDFSGNTGKAIKNSTFQFSTSLVSRITSLIFTVITARLLLPELFGLYSLALSTILIFATLSDLGVSGTLIKFVSSSKSAKKSNAYFSYLLKAKIILFFVSSFFLIVLAKPIAYNYYNKPIFLALIAGSLYILFQGFASLFNGLFQASNNFKKSFYNEIIFQSSRLILIPLVILLTLNRFSTESLLFFIFIALSVSFFFTFLFIYISAKKGISFLKIKTEKLKQKEKIRINKFIIALSAMAVSSVLFGYIDIIILGRFVEAEFIGYYRAAFSLITSAVPLITFSGALFPLFSRLKGKKLERGLKKATRLTILIAIPSSILTFILSPFIVRILFGTEYSLSINILRLFSLLLILLPLISINSSFLISQNKPKKVAQILIIVSVLNIVLNLVLVVYLLRYSPLTAVYGVVIATIISNIFYLGMLLASRKKGL